MGKTFIVSGDFAITGNIYVEAETAQEAVDMVRQGQSFEIEDISDFECENIDQVQIDDDDELTDCDDWE